MPVQAEPALHNLTLLVIQLAEPLFDIGLDIIFLQEFHGVIGAVIRYGLEKRPRGIVHDIRVGRGSALVQPQHVLDILDRFAKQIGDFLGARLMVE